MNWCALHPALSWKLGLERDAKMQNLLEKTHAYLKAKYEIELTEEQVRLAMTRLSRHYRILAKWHSEDEKQPTTSALSVKRREYEDAS